MDSHQAMSQSKQDTAGYVGDGHYSSVICICDYLAATEHTLRRRRAPGCSQMMSKVQRGSFPTGALPRLDQLEFAGRAPAGDPREAP